MKKMLLIAFALLAVGLHSKERLATVYDVKPVAFAAQGTEEGKALFAGQALYQGQRVWTKPSGRAGVALADGSVLRLEGGADMIIEHPVEGPGTLLKLARGLLRLVAAKQDGRRLLIQTGSAVAGVKGTQYQIEAGDGKTEVKVLEGSVELKPISGGASVLVNAQEAAVSYPDRVDAVRKLNAQEVKALKGAMKELVAQKKKEYTKRVRDARGKRTNTQEGK
jgi:ferric-dicitrate binding protein FerR (iron transport regulator)